MDDLQLTKEFEEATAAISNDILQNHHKYKAVGKWLDEYKNQEKVYHIIENKCKAIVDRNFKREAWQESPSFIIPDSVLEICKVLQAVAMVDMDFFPDLEVLISKYQKEADSIPNNFKTMSERIATRAKIKKFIEKIYPTYQYQQGLICDHDCLYTACEDLLEKNDKLGLIDKETKLKVCLLTWLIANPDADKAGLNITEFEKTRWGYNLGNQPTPGRAKVIQILNTCGMLSQWQALACKANEKTSGGKAGKEDGGGGKTDVTPKTDSTLIWLSDAATFYNIPKSTLSKAAAKSPGEPGYLWSSHKGKRVMLRKKDCLRLSQSRTKLRET